MDVYGTESNSHECSDLYSDKHIILNTDYDR